ncbi:MAG: 4-alpha-glucanotransferase [Parvibaculaceae bacterium]
MPSLIEAAASNGVAAIYEGADGRLMHVPETTLHAVLSALRESTQSDPDPGPLPAPRASACHLPDFLDRGRTWGISLQLYELRSSRNAGIGDFADLAELCRIAGAMGADFVGCSPLHALFTADPARASPFFPSTRRFLNPLYIALDHVDEAAWPVEQTCIAERLRAEPLVDYEGVARLKMSRLREAWRRWNGAGHEGRGAFEAFRAQAGDALRQHAVFEALSGHFAGHGRGAGWRQWPAPYRDRRSPQVAAFARANEDGVGFHMWLQWIADWQLRHAAAAARRSGMRIGLYLDLAVAEAPDGSATWSEPDKFLTRLKIGAPPDVFSADGQDWGLAPLSPSALCRAGPGYYDDLIAKAMTAAGALRIDHAMSLRRLFLIPEGEPARSGTYVRYPMQRMLDVLAANSQRSRTIVIGEDLGNVPEGFRDAMRAAGVLSYRVLCFEHRKGEFLPSISYPRLSLACVTTHDLPPLRAWWQAGDIALRLRHGLIDEREAGIQRDQRKDLTAALLRVLRAEGIFPGKSRPLGDEEGISRSLTLGVHRFIARTPSVLAAVRLADMAGETAPTNIPGTAEGYPNWRPKSSLSLEAFARSAAVDAIARVMVEERPR